MKTSKTFSELLSLYDVPTPRYTSYPTVPYWDNDSFAESAWKSEVIKSFEDNNGEISLYIHLPFCEALCTYCGCNKRITKNHAVETPYIESVITEWNLYLKLFGNKKPVIKDLHLGGGTPTFFSSENLEKLLSTILKSVDLHPQHELSIEVHPNYTTLEQLQTLAKLGFTRLSVGVQDFDPDVQFIINRIQTFEQTQKVIEYARNVGFTGINVDIIYGLPRQTLASVELTINYVKQLNPDRIAFYSYAHVPWKSAGQRRYTEADLPSGEKKRALYEFGRKELLTHQYSEIGMDHFAKSDDELFVAEANGELHRNFMGYTTTSSKFLLGLGVSSISDTWGAFMQNVKDVEEYQELLINNKLPIFKGHLLTEEDEQIRQHILNLMCKHETVFEIENNDLENEVFYRLQEFVDNNLVELDEYKITVNEDGKPFVRNIALCLDARYWSIVPKGNLFSKSV